jgi:hypothetical protein
MRLHFRLTGFLLGSAVAALWLLLGASPARAADRVVTDCSSDADLRAHLFAMQGDGGGTLTFDCAEPADPNVIVLTSVLPAIFTDTTVDGDGVIVLDGGKASRHFVVDAAGSLTLRRIRIVKGMAAGDGGAIYNEGSLTILDSHLRENQSTGGSGGAIVTYGPTTIANTEFAFNKAVNGGALYPRWPGAVVEVTASSFHDNEATGTFPNGLGGALLIWDGPQVTIEASTLTANSAGNNAGAIYVTANSALTLTTSTVAFIGQGEGGGIWNEGTTLVSRSLLRGIQGIALGSEEPGNLRLVNSTITENFIGLLSASDSEVAFSTIIDNTSWGILQDTHIVKLANSIVAGNSPGNCEHLTSGAIQSLGFNIADDGSCPLNATGDQPNTDPLLNALFDWGGPTETRRPLENSPALDNGQCAKAGVTTDQRGFARPDGAGVSCDIGAVEAQHHTLTVELTGDGWVTSDPGIIDCGDFCTADLFEWTTVALSATPDEGFTFTGWNTQACAGAGTGVCSVIMVRPAAVFPTFVADAQTVWLPAVQK